jgi:hypothetical protein
MRFFRCLVVLCIFMALGLVAGEVITLEKTVEKAGTAEMGDLLPLLRAEYLLTADLTPVESKQPWDIGVYDLKKFNKISGDENLLAANGLRLFIGKDQLFPGAYLIPCIIRLRHGTKYPAKNLEGFVESIIKVTKNDDPLLDQFTAPIGQNIFRRENWLKWANIKTLEAKCSFKPPVSPPVNSPYSINPPDDLQEIEVGVDFSIYFTLKNTGNETMLLPCDSLTQELVFIAVRDDGYLERSLNEIRTTKPSQVPGDQPSRKWVEVLPNGMYTHIVPHPQNPPALPRQFKKTGTYQVFAVMQLTPFKEHPSKIEAQALRGNLISELFTIKVVEHNKDKGEN